MNTSTPPLLHQPQSLRDDRRTLSASVIYRETVSGKTHLHIPPGIQTAKHIEDLVNLTLDLLAQPYQFAPGKSPVQRFGAKLDEGLQRALVLTPAQLDEHFPKHRLHPYVELFIQCADKERLFDYRALGQALTQAEQREYAAARQRMLTALRAGAREPAFRKKVKPHQDKVRRNLTCIRRYTDAQFRHSRVLVIRVDCMFVDGFSPAHNWTQAQRYREALIKYLNRDLPKVIQPQKERDAKMKPKPIAGYIIGTEYGIETGWHFHVTLFLNGNDFANDVGIASRVCLTWKDEITSGNGRYYNCNHAATVGRYGDKVGVGMVHRHDTVKREVLNDVVTCYGGKGCYYAEAQTGTKDRLLNKGGWPTAKDPTKGGRPEKPRQPQCVHLAQVFSENTKRFSTVWGPREPSQPRVSY